MNAHSASTPVAEASFRQREWVCLNPNEEDIRNLMSFGASALSAGILAGRGLSQQEYAEFIAPKVKNSMPEPFTFQDMEVGAKRLARAIIDRQRIGIWSDYDVDGATSAAVFGRALRACGHEKFTIRIPDRIKEGYGPNTEGLLAMSRDEECDLIFTLDSGIVAFEPLKAARAAGIEIIVIDHHMAHDDLPEAVAVINPNRKDDNSGQGHLCAAGVTFCFFVAVVRELIKADYFDGQEGRPEERPELIGLLDLVALGTVCDVVPLKGLNRAFVTLGQQVLSRRSNAGIAALAAVAGIEPDAPITEETCGWILGPRINAGGRIGDPLAGAMLLLETDRDAAMELARSLDEINAARKEMSDSVTERAMQLMEGRRAGEDRSLAFALVEKAHEGVVGISAGKLREAFDAPAIVVTADHEGNLKGSARSVDGVDIGHIIIEAAEKGLILKGGGHGMAGGLTLRPDQVDAFIAFANREIGNTTYAREGVRIAADKDVRLSDITLAAITSLDGLRPFGRDNPEPLFILNGVRLDDVRVMKEKHFKLCLSDGARTIEGLIWNVAGTLLGDRIMQSRGRVLDVLATTSINEFANRKIPQLMIEDLRISAQQNCIGEAAMENSGLVAGADQVFNLADIDIDGGQSGIPGKTLVKNLKIDHIGSIRGNHLKVQLSDGRKFLTAIRWNGVGGRKERKLREAAGARVNLLGDVTIQEYRGQKSLQIILDDLELNEERLI